MRELALSSPAHHIIRAGVSPVYRCSCGTPLANTLRLALLAYTKHRQKEAP